jgi:epoxide hydrolase 4
MNEIPIHHERIQGDGVELHVARAGVGPAVVLLHGFPEHWQSWRHQIAPLVAAGYSVWAPDLRGYNLSERPPHRDAYHLRHLVEDLAAVMRAAGPSPAHLVGHDWGGVIAWTFAGMHPQLLRKLIILNAPHAAIYLEKVRRPPQLFRSWYVLFFQLPFLPEWALAFRNFRALRKIFRQATKPDAFSPEEIESNIVALSQPGALSAALNYYRANFRREALNLATRSRVGAETLVIWGERDGALGTELLDGLERFAPRVRVHRIPEAGHWVQHEAPAEVNRALLDFLKA